MKHYDKAQFFTDSDFCTTTMNLTELTQNMTDCGKGKL